MRLTCEALGRSSIVPIPCECANAEEREREERKKAEERRVKAEQMRRRFPASGFYRDCTFEADDGKTPNTSSLCERYASPSTRRTMVLPPLGDVGTGKLIHAPAIANRVIDLGFSAFQTDVRYIVNLMEESFDKRQSKLDRVLSYDLLLIEDLGCSA